eukprot:1029866-Rhodomonas_salina.3
MYAVATPCPILTARMLYQAGQRRSLTRSLCTKSNKSKNFLQTLPLPYGPPPIALARCSLSPFARATPSPILTYQHVR